MANILEEVQRYVADKLNADEQLSGCTFLVENMKDIDYEIKKALGKQGLVGLVMTPKAVYQGKYEDLFLAWQLDELEIDIVENPIINRGQLSNYITGQDAAMRLFDVLCPAIGDSEGQFNPVSYEEGEDSGLIVNKCILKALVYGESQDPPQPTPSLNMRFVKLLDEAPPLSVTRQEGWMWPTEDGFVIWQDGEPKPLGGGVSYDEMSAYVDQHLSDYLPLSGGIIDGTLFWYQSVFDGMKGELGQTAVEGFVSLSGDGNIAVAFSPTAFKSTVNQDNFQVAWPSEAGKFALTKEIPLSVSQLSNDSGYLTSADVEPYSTLSGWARYAYQAGYVTTRNTVDNGVEFPVTLQTVEEGTIGKAQISRTYFRNWSLYQYETITYDPPLQMEWQYLDLYRIRTGRRLNVYKGYGWLSEKDSAGRQYAIGVARNSRDNDPTILYYDAGDGNQFNMQVPVGYDNWSGTSLSGLGHTISCTRIAGGVTAKTTYLATVDEIPTLVSQLSNDAGYITSADIPQAQVSCIQDKNDNIINADRSFTTHYPTAPWTLYNNNVKVCELSYDPNEFNWSNIVNENKFILSLEYDQQDEVVWVLRQYQLEAGVWRLINQYFTTAGTYDADSSEIQFINNYSATRNNIVSGTLANVADIPLSVSQLSNDSGFITSAYVDQHLSDYLPLSGGIIDGAVFWYQSVFDGMKGALGQTAAEGFVSLSGQSNTTVSFSPTAFKSTHNQDNIQVTWPTEDGKFALTKEIPLSVSQLSNDAGYITSAYPVKNDGGIQKAVAMTEAQYEAISATADLSTLYVIIEN